MVKLRNMAIISLLIVGLTVVLSGCSTAVVQESASAPSRSSQLLEHMDRTTPEVMPAQPVPDAVQQALMPSLFHSQQGGVSADENRFDVAAEGVEASAFFAGLVEGTSVNMVVHPQVAGTVSLRLKNVTLDEVMSIVQEVYGYHYRTVAGGYQVLPNNLQTRIFEVDYLTLQRSGTSSMKVSSGQVTDGANSSGSSQDSNSSGSSSSSNDSGAGSQIETTLKTDFWPAFQQALEALIGSDDGRKVIIQPQAGLVVVRALPAELETVANYLEKTEGSLQRQVILETKILEVQLSDGFQTGINWGALFDHGNIGQIGGGSSLQNGLSEISGNAGSLNPDSANLIEGLTSSAFGGVFSATLEFGDFQAFVEAVKSQGDVQVLSSPRISTLNNQKAVIKVGTDEFFVTEVSSDTDTETDTSTADITLTPFFSGIALDVTPQISENGQVTLHIHPTVSEVEDQTKVITVNGQDQTLPLAFSSVRESDTIVSARNGQVVVIGGLMKDFEQEQTAGVPILGDLPGVGSLFRHQKDATRKSELIILLRPQVVTRDQDWADDIEQSRQRMQQLM